MTTASPLPTRRAISDDRLLDAARTHRQLTDTALIAAGGGDLSSLSEDPLDRELWHAVIRRHDGRRLQVRLDRRLGTVVLQDDFDGVRRAV